MLVMQCDAAGMLFGWETVMTFVLVSTVYAVAIGEPSFGVMGPFAVGLALFAMVFAGKYHCAVNAVRVMMHLFAQVFAATCLMLLWRIPHKQTVVVVQPLTCPSAISTEGLHQHVVFLC